MAIAELAEIVEAHLERAARHDVTIAILAHGIAEVGAALEEARRRSGNWGRIAGKLRGGREALEAGLRLAASDPPPEVQGLVALADRTLRFAVFLADEVARLSAGESTLA